MRVLMVHNWYSSETPSGEDTVVAAERRLLTAAGVEVRVLGRDNGDLAGDGWAARWRRVRAGLGVVWSAAAV